MILYAVASEQSLGRLFLAGIGPALLLVGVLRRSMPSGATATRRERAQRPRRRRRRIRRCSTTSASRCGQKLAAAAARAALRHPADRRHGRALWRLRHAVGDRRAGRRPGAGADRRHLRHLAAARSSSRSWSTRIRESTMLMMIIGMSLLYSYVMSYLHISQSAARVDRVHASLALGAAGGDPAAGGGPRLLPAAGVDHPDDRADHPAAAQGRRLRPGLVRRRHDHRHGDGARSIRRSASTSSSSRTSRPTFPWAT